ncbi:MAG: hypothetical protein QM653_11880 [Dysgonomonas sp.]|uniref:hypothetical protein n=1 Tax=Dysgonomonas sp. TaxID=1891233 RepID=UPI0039E5A96A
MKTLSIIVLLACLSLSSYSQSKEVLQIEADIESYLLKNPINNNQTFTVYRNLKNEIVKIQTSEKKKLKKKDKIILDALNRKLADSIYFYLRREEISSKINLKKEKRLQIIVDSLKRDSIQKAEIAYKIELEKENSMRRQKQQEFFSIESIVEKIGKNAYSKENIENSLYIYPVGYQGTSTFYELDDMFITIKYVGLEDIAIELGFRLFGEDASFYKKELMRAGFKYQKTFRETMIENHSQGYSNLSGAEIQRYRKFTGKEYVICDIYYERDTFFKFYRARYKK